LIIHNAARKNASYLKKLRLSSAKETPKMRILSFILVVLQAKNAQPDSVTISIEDSCRDGMVEKEVM